MVTTMFADIPERRTIETRRIRESFGPSRLINVDDFDPDVAKPALGGIREERDPAGTPEPDRASCSRVDGRESQHQGQQDMGRADGG